MSRDDEIHEEEDVGKVYDRRLMWRLLGYVRPYRGPAVLAVALIIVSAALSLAGPLTTAVTLDLFVVPVIAGTGEATESAPASRWFGNWLEAAGYELEPRDGVILMAAVFGGVTLLAFVVLFWQSYVMQMMGQRIMFDLRRDIYAHLQRLHVSYFDRRPVGRLVTRATTDVAALNELFTAGLVSIFGDIVMLFGIVGVLFALDWRLALASFAVLPLLFALTIWFKLGARRSYRKVRTQVARINAFLQEHITGMSVVQLNNREERAADDFDTINQRHREAHVRSIFYYAVYYPAVHLVTALGLALIVWYGGLRIIDGALSFGALVAFLQYSQRFYQPLADLSEKYNILQAAMAASERIFELLDSEPKIVSPAEPFSPSKVEGDIEIDGVTFAYKSDENVLHDVSLEIKAGEMVAVVGHTGAGKTTLSNLLLRFYDVDAGAIRVDGVDVRRWDLETLRGHIALVLQDVFLFAGDVAGNIRLGEKNIDDERLRWAASEVEALDFIEKLPDGFGTKVRERGAGLSVGQKQLLAFARALAFDPRILILDEATASIDTETEQRIQKALDRLLVNRTSIVIAHRLSTIQKADRIVVMHKGRVCEQGSHQELLDLGGIYHKLYLLQYKEQAEELASVGSP